MNKRIANSPVINPNKRINAPIISMFGNLLGTRNIDKLAECFHPDWEFHMHSTGAVIKLEEWKEFFGKMLQNPDVKNDKARCIYENEDIIVIHSIGTFPNGSRNAVMYVGLKRNGKIYCSETGSTPLPDKR